MLVTTSICVLGTQMSSLLISFLRLKVLGKLSAAVVCLTAGLFGAVVGSTALRSSARPRKLEGESVSIDISQLILPISHTRYYIQPPCIPWPSLLVANARPHPAMTFSLVVPLLVGEDSAPLLRRPSGGWFRLSSIRCVPTY